VGSVLEYLDTTYPPRYGPEWGSGGIFGLKFYRGVLYFTLAFEAIAYFVRDGGIRSYRYEQVGPLPTSGGDTYNAVDAVDDEIYFGGWVHAPAVYGGRKGNLWATISFVNKYSHVHKYVIPEDRVVLIWRDSLHHESDWVGEVSEVLYDPVNDRLLLARGDGMRDLGIYQLGRDGGGYRQLSPNSALKGSLFYDHACFDIVYDWISGVGGIQCIDLIENKVKHVNVDDFSKISVDGEGVEGRAVGAATSAYGRFFLFFRGGLLVGNPVDTELENLRFVRLFDFGFSGYSPRRTTARPFGGGILVPFNAYSEALIYPTNEFERGLRTSSNTIVGPSVLLYITPPNVRIVGAFGARVTGVEVVSDKILLAVNTMANTGKYDALPIDAGFRGFVTLDHNVINRDPPALRFKVYGFQVGNKVFGGIPLTGYKEPKVIVDLKKSSKLHVYEYDLSLPPDDARVDVYEVSAGRNSLELKPYRNGVVAFKLQEPNPSAKVVIDLV